LRKTPDWRWTLEAQKAFDDIKDFLTKPPILVAPNEEEPLLLYVIATTQVVSVAIVVERKEEGHIQTIQRPVYFLGQILAERKTRYPHIQKILYRVYLAKKKLVHYFDAHPVTMVTSFPLGEIVNNRDATRRIAKWAMELMAYDIAYAPRTAIKS
jgi:hypothetical protein